jgi:hypothetical protein
MTWSPLSYIYTIYSLWAYSSTLKTEAAGSSESWYNGGKSRKNVILIFTAVGNKQSNVALESFGLLIRPGQNLSPETGYPESGFRGFLQLLQANARAVTQTTPRPLPCTSFPIHYSFIIL